MLRILKHLRWKEWLLVAACVVLIVGQVQLDLALPDYMSEITPSGADGRQPDERYPARRGQDAAVRAGVNAADGLHDILYRTDCITLLRTAARRNVPQGGRLLKRGNQPLLHSQPDYPHDQRHFAIADVLFLRDAVAD